jgi:hypothetical protein
MVFPVQLAFGPAGGRLYHNQLTSFPGICRRSIAALRERRVGVCATQPAIEFLHGNHRMLRFILRNFWAGGMRVFHGATTCQHPVGALPSRRDG